MRDFGNRRALVTALTQILEQDEHDMDDIDISFLEELLMDLKKKLPQVDNLRTK
jgi:undecaprenyl pyrophosphate synthase